MLFSELHKIMVKKVTFVDLGGTIAPITPSASAPAQTHRKNLLHKALARDHCYATLRDSHGWRGRHYTKACKTTSNVVTFDKTRSWLTEKQPWNLLAVKTTLLCIHHNVAFYEAVKLFTERN